MSKQRMKQAHRIWWSARNHSMTARMWCRYYQRQLRNSPNDERSAGRVSASASAGLTGWAYFQSTMEGISMLEKIESFDECVKRYFTDSETGQVDFDLYGPDIHMLRMGYNTALAHMDLRDAHIEAMRKRLDILASLLARIADWSMHRENENDLCKWVFRGTFMNEIDSVLSEHVYPFAAVNNPPNA